MSDSSTHHDNPLALDFKSATLYALRVVLHRLPMQDLVDALERRMSDAGSFFENEPVVIDASAIEEPIDWAILLSALRKHSLYPIGVMAQDVNVASAKDQGLTCVDLAHPAPRPTTSPAPDKEVPVVAPPSAKSSGGKATVPEASIPAIAPAAMVINRPLRSGQRIYARNTDLIVIGIVNRGAEVIADFHHPS